MPKPSSRPLKDPGALTVKDFAGKEGIQRINEAIDLVNEQSSAYREVRDQNTYESDAIHCDKLREVILGFGFVITNLNSAINARLFAQSALWTIKTWDSSHLSIHDVKIAAESFIKYIPHIADNIDVALEYLTNIDVLEEVLYGCTQIKQEIVLGYISYFKDVIRWWGEADAQIEKHEQQHPELFGPKQASFASFFPTPNQLSHVLLKAPAVALAEKSAESDRNEEQTAAVAI